MAIGLNQGAGEDVVVTNAFQPMMQVAYRNQQMQVEQQKQKKAEAFKLQDEVNNELSKINANGLRQADLETFNKAYGRAKELYYAMSRETTPEGKRAYKMQINDSLNEAKNIIYASKEAQGVLDGYLKDYGTMAGQRRVGEFKSTIDGLKEKGYQDILNNRISKADYMNTWDNSKLDSMYKGLSTQLFKDPNNLISTEAIERTQTGTGGRRTDVWRTTDVVRADAIERALSDRYQRDENFKNYFDERFRGVDINQGIRQLADELSSQYFVNTSTKDRSGDKRSSQTINVNLTTQTPSEQLQQVPLTIGKFTSDNSITRNEKGVQLSGNKVFFDPQTGNRIPVGRDRFSVDFTQDVKLGVDANGNPVDVNDPNAVGTQNFAVGVTADPSRPSSWISDPATEEYYKRTVLIPQGDRQLFGKSKTIKTDAVRRDAQNRNNQSNSVSSQKPKFN